MGNKHLNTMRSTLAGVIVVKYSSISFTIFKLFDVKEYRDLDVSLKVIEKGIVR